MQEIAFPGFKFQKLPGDYALTHVAFGHWYPPLISNDKLRLIFSFTFCAFFHSFISNTSIVSINFQISKIFLASTPPDPHSFVVCWAHTWPSAIAIPL